MQTEFGENKQKYLTGAGEKLFLETSERAEKITELVQNLRMAQKEIGITYLEYLNFRREEE